MDQRIGHLVELLVGHRQARDLQRQQLVAAHQPLGEGAHAGGLVEGAGERMLGMRAARRQEGVGAHIGAVAAAFAGDPGRTQPGGEALGLVHRPLHFGLVGHLGEAAGEHLHRPPGHAAVGVQPFVDHDFVEEELEVGRVVGGEKAAGVAVRILGAVHQHDVGGLGDQLGELGHRAIGHPGLVALDVPGVLDHPREVEHQAQPVPVGQGAHGFEVGQAERMLAVGEALRAEEGRPGRGDHLLEPGEIEVAGEDRLGMVARVVDLDAARGVQVDPAAGVAGQHRAGRTERLDQELHRAERVVGGADVGVAEHAVDRALEGLEVARAGVGLVADELAGELLLRHRAGAVRHHVEGDLRRCQLEDVEARRREIALAFVGRGEGDRTNCLDLVRLVGGHGNGHGGLLWLAESLERRVRPSEWSSLGDLAEMARKER